MYESSNLHIFNALQPVQWVTLLRLHESHPQCRKCVPAKILCLFIYTRNIEILCTQHITWTMNNYKSEIFILYQRQQEFVLYSQAACICYIICKIHSCLHHSHCLVTDIPQMNIYCIIMEGTCCSRSWCLFSSSTLPPTHPSFCSVYSNDTSINIYH